MTLYQINNDFFGNAYDNIVYITIITTSDIRFRYVKAKRGEVGKVMLSAKLLNLNAIWI